jgi:hypothetical protein
MSVLCNVIFALVPTDWRIIPYLLSSLQVLRSIQAVGVCVNRGNQNILLYLRLLVAVRMHWLTEPLSQQRESCMIDIIAARTRKLGGGNLKDG